MEEITKTMEEIKTDNMLVNVKKFDRTSLGIAMGVITFFAVLIVVGNSTYTYITSPLHFLTDPVYFLVNPDLTPTILFLTVTLPLLSLMLRKKLPNFAGGFFIGGVSAAVIIFALTSVYAMSNISFM